MNEKRHIDVSNVAKPDIIGSLKMNCIVGTDKKCGGCPECSWHTVNGKSYMLPDRNSPTCLSCLTGHNYFLTIYGVCSITNAYCITVGQCNERCPHYNENAPSRKDDEDV